MDPYGYDRYLEHSKGDYKVWYEKMWPGYLQELEDLNARGGTEEEYDILTTKHFKRWIVIPQTN
jgi:hypothetical protein